MKKLLVLVLSGLFIISVVPGAEITPPAVYLLHPYSAMSASMGEIGTGMTSEYYSSQYNPAARENEKGLYGTIAYCSHFKNISNNSVLLHWNRGRYSLGMNFFLSNIGGIESRERPTDEPDYVFSSHHLVWSLIGSYNVQNRFNLGIAYKRLFERIDYTDMSSFAVDLGADATYKNFILGLAILNWGPKVKYEKYLFSLPKRYRAGLSYSPSPEEWGAGFDVVKPDFGEFEYNLGGWWKPIDWAKLKGGLFYGRETQSFTCGASFIKYPFKVNYAFRPYSHHLTMSHLFSLSILLRKEK